MRWVWLAGCLAVAIVVGTRDRTELDQPVLDEPAITYRSSNVTMTIDEELARRRAIEAILAIPVHGSQPTQPLGGVCGPALAASILRRSIRASPEPFGAARLLHCTIS